MMIRNPVKIHALWLPNRSVYTILWIHTVGRDHVETLKPYEFIGLSIIDAQKPSVFPCILAAKIQNPMFLYGFEVSTYCFLPTESRRSAELI